MYVSACVVVLHTVQITSDQACKATDISISARVCLVSPSSARAGFGARKPFVPAEHSLRTCTTGSKYYPGSVTACANLVGVASGKSRRRSASQRPPPGVRNRNHRRDSHLLVRGSRKQFPCPIYPVVLIVACLSPRSASTQIPAVLGLDLLRPESHLVPSAHQ